MSKKKDKAKPVRNVDPNFRSFVFKEYSKIREAHATGDTALAMELLTTLISYLAEDAQEHFWQRAQDIRDGIMFVAQMPAGTDLFTAELIKKRRVEQASRALFDFFLKDFAIYLDQRGYMEEQPKEIPTGRSRSDKDLPS